MTQFTW